MQHAPLAFLLVLLAPFAFAADPPAPRPVPTLQAIPLPDAQVSFQNAGREIARYYFGRNFRRPFIYPIIGPAGRSLTRMGHPHDPESHSHHNSVWISHNDVNGVSFWDDRSKGRIVHQRIESFDDEGDTAEVTTLNHWINETDNTLLLVERRRTHAHLLQDGEWLLYLDIQLTAPRQVTLGQTPFGLIGVRMAKTIGVNDGGGVIRNSAGAVNEPAIFWKPARWVDYSGPITATAIEGITLMDHPANPNHPAAFHVRGDGWMGASLTLNAPRTLEPAKPLTLRYGLYIHAGQPPLDRLQQQWESFARTLPLGPPPPKQ